MGTMNVFSGGVPAMPEAAVKRKPSERLVAYSMVYVAVAALVQLRSKLAPCACGARNRGAN